MFDAISRRSKDEREFREDVAKRAAARLKNCPAKQGNENEPTTAPGLFIPRRPLTTWTVAMLNENRSRRETRKTKKRTKKTKTRKKRSTRVHSRLVWRHGATLNVIPLDCFVCQTAIDTRPNVSAVNSFRRSAFPPIGRPSGCHCRSRSHKSATALWIRDPNLLAAST